MRRAPSIKGFSTNPNHPDTDTSWKNNIRHIDPNELIGTLKKFGCDLRESPDGRVTVKECKLCDKGNRQNLDNLWKLSVWPSGGYYCFRCSKSGNWQDLKEKACALEHEAGTADVHVFSVPGAPGSQPKHKRNSPPSPPPAPYVIPSQAIASKPFSNLFPNENRFLRDTVDDKIDRAEVKKYLNEVRGLNDAVLQRYGVGFVYQDFFAKDNTWQTEVCITFPWQMPGSALQDMSVNFTDSADAAVKGDVIVRTKYRAVSTKGLQRILPKGGMWGFFGWNTVPSATLADSSSSSSSSSGGESAVNSREKSGSATDRAIILTEGEYDAMAVSQGLSTLPDSDPLKHVPAISLPNGCGSIPDSLIPMLAPFNKIYLWLDNDESGQKGGAKFVAKLGGHRCVLVRPLPDALVSKILFCLAG